MEQTNISLPRVLESDDMIIYYFTDYTSSNGQHQIIEFDTKLTTATVHEDRISQVLKLILNDYFRSYKLKRVTKLAQPPNRWQVMFLVNCNNDTDSNYFAEQHPQRADDSDHEEEAPRAPPSSVFQKQSPALARFEDDGNEEQEQYDDVLEQAGGEMQAETGQQFVQQHVPPSPSVHSFQLRDSPPATSGRDERNRNCSGGNTGGGRALRTRKPTLKSAEAQNREHQIAVVRDMAETVMKWQVAFEAKHLRLPKPQDVKEKFGVGLPLYKKIMTRIRYVKRVAAPVRTDIMTAGHSFRRQKSVPDFRSDVAAASTLAQMSVAMVNSNSNPTWLGRRGDDSVAAFDEEEED